MTPGFVGIECRVRPPVSRHRLRFLDGTTVNVLRAILQRPHDRRFEVFDRRRADVDKFGFWISL